jgi:hypothetical protein
LLAQYAQCFELHLEELSKQKLFKSLLLRLRNLVWLTSWDRIEAQMCQVTTFLNCPVLSFANLAKPWNSQGTVGEKLLFQSN